MQLTDGQTGWKSFRDVCFRGGEDGDKDQKKPEIRNLDDCVAII